MRAARPGATDRRPWGRPLSGLTVLTVVLVVLLALSTAGCGLVPSRPSPSDWRSAARQSLEDTVSEVATVRLVLQQQRRHRLPGKYAVAAATTSEEALGKAEDSILTQQPPPGTGRTYDDVSTALGDASDLVTAARIALVRDRQSAYPALITRLDRLADRLDQLRGRL